MFKYLGEIINSRGISEDEINERTVKAGKLYNTIKTSKQYRTGIKGRSSRKS